MESQPQNPKNVHPWKQSTKIRMRDYQGKIEITLYVAAYYKSRDWDSQSAAVLRPALKLADSFNGWETLIITFSWDQDHVPIYYEVGIQPPYTL